MDIAVPILFYSKFCKFCDKANTIIDSNKDTIKLIKISYDKFRKNIPLEVNTLPCLYFQKENKFIFGKDVFNWLNNIIDDNYSNRNNLINSDYDKYMKIDCDMSNNLNNVINTNINNNINTNLDNLINLRKNI